MIVSNDTHIGPRLIEDLRPYCPFAQELKHAFLNELNHGLARETYAQRGFFPFGGGMVPLDRAWDDEPWSRGRQ